MSELGATSKYDEWPVFKDYYFEDSFVQSFFLGKSWFEDENELKAQFVIEAVMCYSHPNFHEPRKGEVNSYAEVKIEFPKVTEIEWERVNVFPSTDLDGSVDFGNIDLFYLDEDGRYIL
ncbi:MAG: hypothetical protein M3R04_08460, partial [bacterium]|nr:hypothetical protein [bacterium]